MTFWLAAFEKKPTFAPVKNALEQASEN